MQDNGCGEGQGSPGEWRRAVRDVEAYAPTERARLLKRRVSRLADWVRLGAMLAVAWLVWRLYATPPSAEVLDGVREGLSLPGRDARIVLVIAGLGLPIALLVVWAAAGLLYNLVYDAIAAALPRAFHPLIGPALLALAVAAASAYARDIDGLVTYRFLQVVRLAELAGGESSPGNDDLEALRELLERATEERRGREWPAR